MYHTPDDLADVGDDDEDAEERGNRAERGSQDGAHPLAAPVGGTGAQQHRDSVHVASAPNALADVMSQRFPIPIEVRDDMHGDSVALSRVESKRYHSASMFRENFSFSQDVC